MRRIFGLSILKFVAFCFIYSVGSQANAQDIADYISIAPPEIWVEVQPVLDEEFALSADQKLSYKLLSYQAQISPSDNRNYRRHVVDLQNASALEDNGTITIDFDPSYKKIKFHHIRVSNAQGVRDVLKLDEGKLFRTETDRDKLLFDGTLQFSLAIKGLQVGDRLDYAYTSHGKNPSFGEGYFKRGLQAYSTPVQHLYYKTNIAQGMPVHVKLHGGATSPVRSTKSGQIIFISSQRNIEGHSANDNRPAWHYGFPAFEISSYENWEDVGNHFAPYYNIPKTLDPTIQAVVETIRTGTTDPKEQTRRALNYVQENIRYLGLEMGTGGFEPRQPSLVFQRRFGDCKDVTLFLLSLLKALNIEANPALVHTEERAGFLVSQPGHWAFDHIVVWAEIDGKGYALDATRGKQLGTLDKLDQGNFQKGLLLKEGGSKVIEMPETAYEWRKDFYDEFDLVTDSNDILYTLTAKYFGENADANYEWYQNDGLADVEKSFFEYFADFYPSIKIEKPTEVEVDKEAASFTIKAFYRIVDGWEKMRKKTRKPENHVGPSL